MNEAVRAYIIEVLTAFGQMNHPRGKDAEAGVMTMKVETRSQLIAKGWWDILTRKDMLRSYSDFKFDNHPSILYASKIVIGAASTCHRVVVRKLSDKEYVTHLENVMLDGDTWRHGDFYQGNYFTTQSDDANVQREKRDEALSDFNERSAKL